MKTIKTVLFSSAIAAIATLTGCASVSQQAGHASSAQRSFFYVGGTYTGAPGKELMMGQMYVEKLQPKEVKQPYPLVLIHGAAQTATNWMMTPDGRMGWADHYLNQGYVVYMVDQPARGRSAWHPDINGKLRMFTAQQLETLFTASAELGKWPQAKSHTQWPGSGRRGDPVFDAFYATQVESLASDGETQTLAQKAGAALLDKIGPAVLLTHSQSGLLGWVIAEARPQLVKAIVAIEPSGPPFHNNNANKSKARAWGITDIPVTYDPPVTDPAQIQTAAQPTPDGDGLIACTLQAEPARKLVNFQKIPVLVTVSESSYHAPYDHCTAKYLRQAGAPVEFIRLQERGIRGNGHMVMLEKNNIQVADFLHGWISTHVKR
ncbi:alpha/beta hydrolase [uncultured Limnohabitans sp.]|uniref:alpha/beta hydrolase n=1 Tax=uncultured Limnohabitans sp. TaxID=768543 RepID=UPI002620908C|nr:alpha/beta hydrolase [uncultured Limnohabitans sp.]